MNSNSFDIPNNANETDILFYEPEITNDVVYEDDKCIVKRIWKWNVSWITEEKETSLLKVKYSDYSNKKKDKFTFIKKDGKKLKTEQYDYADDFSEGLALICIDDYGYGYVDENLNIIIPTKYDYAERFKGGFAKVKYNGKSFFIDKKGNEIFLVSKSSDQNYLKVLNFHNGKCLVSTKIFEKNDFVCQLKYDQLAGLLGVINEFGEEVVIPQYVFANDFRNGIAIVCKGKWQQDKFGKFYIENPIWGGINTELKEVIPFVYDEIKFFDNTNEVFIAHYGGWNDGHWGVIDQNGKWVAQPIFEDIRFKFHNGLFAFSNAPTKKVNNNNDNSYYKGKDVLEDKFYNEDGEEFEEYKEYGIYDTKLQKVLIEPQFYWVDFLQDDLFQVDVFDKEQRKYIHRIIDRNGKEQFHSIYSLFFELNSKYLSAGIWDENGNKMFGVIDKKGNIIYPCEEGTGPVNFFIEQNRIRFFNKHGKGIKNFDGDVIIPPIYKDIYYEREALLGVKGKNNLNGLITPNGKEVVPIEFESVDWLQDGKHILCCKQGFCQMLEYIEK